MQIRDILEDPQSNPMYDRGGYQPPKNQLSIKPITEREKWRAAQLYARHYYNGGLTRHHAKFYISKLEIMTEDELEEFIKYAKEGHPAAIGEEGGKMGIWLNIPMLGQVDVTDPLLVASLFTTGGAAGSIVASGVTKGKKILDFISKALKTGAVAATAKITFAQAKAAIPNITRIQYKRLILERAETEAKKFYNLFLNYFSPTRVIRNFKRTNAELRITHNKIFKNNNLTSGQQDLVKLRAFARRSTGLAKNRVWQVFGTINITALTKLLAALLDTATADRYDDKKWYERWWDNIKAEFSWENLKWAFIFGFIFRYFGKTIRSIINGLWKVVWWFLKNMGKLAAIIAPGVVHAYGEKDPID